MRFRFLHCADVHLGRRRGGGDARATDYFTALGAVVAHACAEGVDAVLVAGDLFDAPDPPPDVVIAACETLRPLRAAGIPVLAIEGNHDKRLRGEPACALDILAAEGYLRLLRPDIDGKNLALRSWSPDGGGACIAAAPGLLVAGLGFFAHAAGERLVQAAALLPADTCLILLAHTIVTGAEDVPYGYCAAADIAPLGDRVAYMATGHRHARALGTPLPFVFNPGALEFVYPQDYHRPADLRGFLDVSVTDEEADGDACGADLPDDAQPAAGTDRAGAVHRFGAWRFDVRHVPTDKRPAVTLRVDISACASPEAVTAAVLAAAAARIDEALRARGPIVVVRLEGRFGVARALLPIEEIRARVAGDHGAVHVEVLDRDLVGAAGDAMLVHDGGDTAEMAQRARDIAATLLRAAGLAVGREEAFATALIEAKEELAGRSLAPGSEQLDALADRLRPFVDGGGDA